MLPIREKSIEVVVLIVEVFERFFDDHCPQLAAALVYYSIFSIPPFIVILVMTAGSVLDPSAVQEMLAGTASRFLSPRAASQIVTLAEDAKGWAQEGPWWSIGLSILVLLFGATRAFAQLQTALNRAWAIPEKHRDNVVRLFLSKRLVSFVAITVMIVFVLALFIVRALVVRFEGTLENALPSRILPLLDWASGTTLSMATAIALLGCVYRYLPDAKITWKQVLPGAILTAALFEGTKSLMTLYLTHMRADFFGQAASLAVLMTWLHVSTMLLFFGAEFTEVWSRRYGTKLGPGDEKHETPTFTLRLDQALKKRLLT